MKYDIEQLLEAGEVIQIYPEGYSMYPMFVPGRDAAVIKKADVKKIRRADVVLYRRKGSILVLHRVVKRKGGQFYMAGDNQTEVEGPVEEDQIRGILTAFVRNGRRISVKNPVYVIWSGLWLMFLPVRGIFVTVHSYLVPVTDFADASHSKSAKSATTTVSYGIFSSENAYL